MCRESKKTTRIVPIHLKNLFAFAPISFSWKIAKVQPYTSSLFNKKKYAAAVAVAMNANTDFDYTPSFMVFH